jgi:glutamate formiminotransferase
MTKLIQCVPNFSEGRDKKVLDMLLAEAKNIPGVTLLDFSADVNHNRSVFTLVGTPEGIANASIRLCKLASENIDMTKHSGEHPRMGATDVIPFIPIQNVEMDECIELSREVARRIWNELQIPSFLYEESAKVPGRKNLAVVRKGQFEGMKEKLLLPEWEPDYGKREIHPTAGIIAIGARMPLIAYNVNLNTSDINIASKIAKAIRSSSGGYQHCKAIGVMLDDRNIAQVSMNMVNFEVNPLYRIFETIRFEAARWGVEILGSEIVGLAPMKALIDCTEYYLRIEDFDYDTQVLENHLF